MSLVSVSDRARADIARQPGSPSPLLAGLFGVASTEGTCGRRVEHLDPTPEWAAMFAPPRRNPPAR